ncbi:CcmD family protein [Pedobacter antarcticus]|uniref:CcmD family protein n=2 Tax=Pedobacter antarcticus TaxID=34086 RepID=A0A081PFE7_9SPHI|nr:hypothetical protein [Pedobacter antarcticus]KEQ29420.1 hypothetical protein N180_13390 [Pedobacter antarcticus 4BY]SDM67837.1 hypothetical protein SAMN04488084_11145 [Pedobacter antarcticus]SFF39917.1 hypothetical protein SAMN03003324_03673 [Pedobacter antarcticus]
MKSLTTTFVLLLVSMQLFAQPQESAVVDTLAGSEKIYVVAACALLILLALLFLLFSVDRRVKKLEKKSEGK